MHDQTPARTRPAPAPGVALALALCLCGLLAACETAPRSGGLTTAQVIEVVRERESLRDGHPELHAALRAGVTAADLEAGRLVRGECVLPDPDRPQQPRWITVTTLLPAGTRLAPGSRITVRDARPAWPSNGNSPPRRLHGQFVQADAAAPDREAPVCQAPGTAPTLWQLRVHGTLPAWAYPFARASLQRLDALGEDELRAGRVLRLGCQLKVLDGGDWYVPVWVARAPQGLVLAPGDIVTLRAGAQADSTDSTPQPEILQRRTDLRAPGGNAVVRCG